MQGVLYIITFICIVYGIYKMVIDDQSGLAAASFIFGVLTFLITLVPTETPTNAGGMQNPVNTEIQKEWESEIKETETETDEKGDSVEEDISGNDIVAKSRLKRLKSAMRRA